ncbi:hypothetical protein MBLNU457_4725t1 [Dothideomycetes sp. NU457]
MQSLLEYRRQKTQAGVIHAQHQQFINLKHKEAGGNDVLGPTPSRLSLTSTAALTQERPSEASTPTLECGNVGGLEKSDDEPQKIQVKCDTDNRDQADPHNWSRTKRMGTTTLLFLLVFSQGWVSACDSNVLKPMSKEYHVSETAQTLATAMFFFGISAGSLIVGPLSEELGRNPVYLVSSIFYLGFTLGDALAPNFGGQITMRFLAGLFASPALSCYGGSLADLYETEERQYVWAIFAWAPLLSPVLSPVAGGWIDHHIPWRWVYWIGLIFSGAVFVLALLFLPETSSPMIIQWRTHHLRKITGDDSYTCELEAGDSLSSRLAQNLTRPAKFFTTELIVISLGLYLIVIYVVLFTFLNGFEYIFTDTYNLSPGITSLAFVGVTIGALISTAISPLISLVHRRISGQKDVPGSEVPELVLIPAVVASPFFSISLFWLGWTNYPSISPWSGYLATVMFGYSIYAIFVSSYIYIINSYGTFSSSALGSITMARYLFSAGLLVAARPMYKGIGVHWSLTFQGCLGLVCLPFPFLLYRYGHVLRKKSDFINAGD